MNIEQARTFAHIVAGHELCTNAGEDEAAQYPISPVALAFMQGAIGSHCVCGDCLYRAGRPGQESVRYAEQKMGEFFKDVGEALIRGKPQQKATP